jgi:mRNA interferase MazF
MTQGEIWWVDFGEPKGSEPGFRRPALIVQDDELNRSRIATVITVPLTSNLHWATAPGNVLLPAAETGLSKDSVANVSLIVAVDRRDLQEPAGRISRRRLEQVFMGIDRVLGR